LDILIFLLGLVLLIGGAWILISGGTRIAAVLGIPPVVVGLTVVAFGTSAPELFVSILGALRGSTGLVLGNVIGSNVANLGLILAVAAILRPVIVEKGLSRNEVPFMLVASLALAGMVWDGNLNRFDASVLVVGFAFFMIWTYRNRDRGTIVPIPAEPAIVVPPQYRGRELVRGSGLVMLGIVGLASGGHFIVDAAVRIATSFGVSETLIGLTMVAIGTSLPELATTIIAAIRDEDDLALGNIVGSNLFNVLAVAGPVGLVWKLQVEGSQQPLDHLFLHPSPNQLQLVSMVLLAIMVTLMITFGRGRIGRKRGLLLLATYVLIMYLWTT
jgi:cation:H+ antiporter